MLSAAARRGWRPATRQAVALRQFSTSTEVALPVIPSKNFLKPTEFKVANLDSSGLNYKSFGPGQALIRREGMLGVVLFNCWLGVLGYGFWCLKWHHPGNFPPSWTAHERGWL
eukprot:CAMPEP_0178992940 /NCGR_PEP_ID=MMETSP0795-20121207/6406_1 /TAXON_ID=88552 /ORGANISM="Amoebophrya sp., Strain Ameob2" /LENGTH=112 /DNA_ID=CAMNT_0020684903 /DNA_START=99 /DNA_END=437 /DNA_ORIENTATION=-